MVVYISCWKSRTVNVSSLSGIWRVETPSGCLSRTEAMPGCWETLNLRAATQYRALRHLFAKVGHIINSMVSGSHINFNLCSTSTVS